MKDGIPFSIVMVEDDDDDRMIIDEGFKEIGYVAEVKKMHSGDALLDYLDKIDPQLYPSLIVLDNTRSRINAVDTLGVLKQDDRYRHIPVVVYCNSISPATKQKLLALGAYTCIEKGDTLKEVVANAKDLKTLAQVNQKE